MPQSETLLGRKPNHLQTIPHWTSRHEMTRVDLYGRGRAPLFTQAERRAMAARYIVWFCCLIFCFACWYFFGCALLHILHGIAAIVKGGR